MAAFAAFCSAQETDKPKSSSWVDSRAERAWLMKPKASPARTPVDANTARKAFAKPPAEFGSMPLWVWNDDLQWPRLKEQLRQFKEQGITGVFIHPRPGLMTPYMSEKWFEMWKLSLEEGKRLGLLVNIYDENSYPSGFAGGLVPSQAPDTAAQFVQVETDVPFDRVPWYRFDTVAVYAMERDPSGKISSARPVVNKLDWPVGKTAMVFRIKRARGNPWSAEFPYIDVTNPRTAKTFIETTFEPYRKRFGAEFGKSIKWIFDDEANIATGGAEVVNLALPYSYNTAAEFQKRNGYSLDQNLASLYWDIGDYRKVRFDYWQTLHDLWKENYVRPLFQWCDQNNIEFTGHWLEHEWPFPFLSPADASLFAYMHVPGIDMLRSQSLRTRGVDPHMLFTIKEVASVAHQMGKRAFAEAYGGAGFDSTIEYYKRMGDWLIVHGINFFDQHLSYGTVRGARKRDYPQSFSDVAEWWSHYRPHAEHVHRLSYILSQGNAKNRVLVIPATTTGFMLARRDGPYTELEKLRRGNGDLVQFLADRQVDYDLGDEYVLEWLAESGSRQLKVGEAAYDVVVLPDNMINLRHQTVKVLEDYLAAGGEILTLVPPPPYIDGRPSDRVQQLFGKYSSQVHSIQQGWQGLLAEIHRRAKPHVTFDVALPQGVAFYERYLADRTRVLMFNNAGLSQVRARATIEAGAIEVWDALTGRTSDGAFAPAGTGRISFDIDLAPAGSLLLLAKQSGKAAPARPETRFTELKAASWRVEAESPNVMVLDYCDLSVNGAEHKNVNVFRANHYVWQGHGFERPAWDNSVQFRNHVFDRNKFGPESGFAATFRFHVDDAAALAGMELALEAPELYKVAVNGNTVDFGSAKPWLDQYLKSIPIERFAKTGENMVTVTASPFDVRMELENIYLRGRFSVAPDASGFRIAAQKPLTFGSWAGQGWSFYDGTVRYSTDIEMPTGQNTLGVELKDWHGSMAEVLLDGKPAATLQWPPYRVELPAKAGKHSVGIRVISTPRNTFGPYHHPHRPRFTSSDGYYREFPEHQPAGREYQIIDYGINAAPVMTAGETK
jgi:hypothetical protein